MSDFTDRQWELAGQKARARANAVRGPIRAAVTAAIRAGLEGVEFASFRAEQLARDYGLTWPDFEDLEPSGQSGYTANDVRSIGQGG